MFSYFETEKAIYTIINGKHYKHLKEWDYIPYMKYYNVVISVHDYIKAYRRREEKH